jgi:hypothetical protein
VDKIAKNRKNVVVNKWTPFKNASKVVVISGHVVYMILEFFFVLESLNPAAGFNILDFFLVTIRIVDIAEGTPAGARRTVTPIVQKA